MNYLGIKHLQDVLWSAFQLKHTLKSLNLILSNQRVHSSCDLSIYLPIAWYRDSPMASCLLQVMRLAVLQLWRMMRSCSYGPLEVPGQSHNWVVSHLFI